MTSPGVHQFGGGGRPPFDDVAGQVLATTRARMDTRPPARPVLSEADRAEAEKAAREDRWCRFCAGLHALPTTTACPRLAGGKLDGDGKIVEFTYWPGREWAEGRVVFAEDALEEGTEEEAGDGAR